jgi:hypothetical protein
VGEVEEKMSCPPNLCAIAVVVYNEYERGEEMMNVLCSS